MQSRKAYQEIETARTSYVLAQGIEDDQANDALWLPPDGHIVAITHGRTVLLWDSADGICLHAFPMQRSRVNTLACSPDDQRIALGVNRAVVVRDVRTGKYLRTYSDQNWGEVQALSWSPNGRFLAWTGNPFYAVQVWDTVEHHQIYLYHGHETQGPAALAWSPDSTKLATGSCHGGRMESYDIQVWEAVTGQKLVSFACHTEPIRAVAWSPDGAWIVSGGDDGTLQVIDARIMQQYCPLTREIRYEHQQVMVLSWSPDGTRIAIGLSNGTVVVRSAALDQVFLSYRCHYASIKRVAWSPDGCQIASVADDHTAKIWSALDASSPTL
jgi:WD40 repeat protein